MWIRDVKEKNFPIIVQKFHSKFYDFLEAKRSRNDKVLSRYAVLRLNLWSTLF